MPNVKCEAIGHLLNSYGVCTRHKCYYYTQVAPKFPPGSPEYEAYAAELRAELAKLNEGNN